MIDWNVDVVVLITVVFSMGVTFQRLRSLERAVMNGLNHRVSGLCTRVSSLESRCVERGKVLDAIQEKL